MNYKVLYRKYRPDRFSNIVGQDYSIQMLKNAIIHQKISHAYLFTGPRGTGKTSTAKVFAKTINCLNPIDGEACGECTNCLSFATSPDIIEIDAASNNGVDDIRELINNVKIAPSTGKYKIYIIDEVHMMTTSAFNALLLTLEEPPKHAVFIMATTNVESVPITILSRCQRFNFQKISLENLKKQIKYVCEEENIKITDEAVSEIASLSEGGMRDALSLLDQLSSNEEEITLDKILENYGSISSKFIKDLLESVANNDVSKVVEAIQDLESTSSDYKVFIKKVVQELSHIAVLIKTGNYSGNFSFKQVRDMIFKFNDILNKININMNPFSLILLVLLGDIQNNPSKVELNVVNSSILNVSNESSVPIQEQGNREEEMKIVDQENQYLQKLREIRVNNCFCGAKKEYLIQYQANWKKISDDAVTDPDIASYVLDFSIVAASSDYILITSKLESTAKILNSKLDQMEGALKHYFDKTVHFFALSEQDWRKEKEEYIAKLKQKFEYSLMDESVLDEMKPKKGSELEEITTNVFNRDKIEIV